MKIFLTIFLLMFIYTSYAQDCEVDTNPISPVKDVVFKKSVTRKNEMHFYLTESTNDSLIVRVQFNDLYRRVVYVGDSAIIQLKNGHKINLINITEYVSRPVKINLVFEQSDFYMFAFTAWIHRKDVEMLSQSTLKLMRFYSKINEDFNPTKETRLKKRYSDFTEHTSASFVFKSSLRLLAECALKL
jgi:lipopolysaccharide export LptBFGC system permease protein LptF